MASKDLVNQKAAAALAGVSLSAFRRWPIAPVRRRGREVLYEAAAVQTLAERRRGGVADLTSALTDLLDAKAARVRLAADRLAAEIILAAAAAEGWRRVRRAIVRSHPRAVRNMAKAAAGSDCPAAADEAVRDALYKWFDQVNQEVRRDERRK